MVISEKYTVLWYSGFTSSGCFSSCLQPGLLGAKSANVKNFCTKAVYAGRTFAKNACAEGVSVTGVYTEMPEEFRLEVLVSGVLVPKLLFPPEVFILIVLMPGVLVALVQSKT